MTDAYFVMETKYLKTGGGRRGCKGLGLILSILGSGVRVNNGR